MHKKITILLLSLLLSGCTPVWHAFMEDIRLFMEDIRLIGCGTADSAVLNAISSVPMTRENLERMRAWSAGIDDYCIRHAYIKWLYVFEDEIDEKEAMKEVLKKIPLPPTETR